MNKFLTIAIPTHNRLPYLKETVQRVHPQLTEEIELLISDNGSTDGTPEYLNEFSTIKTLFFKENRGFDRNIIRCLEEASGEYIAFLGDDDLPDPEAFAKICDALKRIKPKALCINHYPFFKGDPKKRLKPYFPEKEIHFESGWEFFCFCRLGHLSSLVVRRDLALKNLPFVKDHRMCAHLDSVGRVVLKEPGPFYYMGTLSIAGRVPDRVRYVPIEACVINQGAFWRDLFHEGTIDKKQLKNRLFALLKTDLLKMAFKAKIEGQLAPYRRQLNGLFNDYWLYKLCVKPLYWLPRAPLYPIYKFLKGALWIERFLSVR